MSIHQILSRLIDKPGFLCVLQNAISRLFSATAKEFCMNVLLIEPPYRNNFPPLGLRKLRRTTANTATISYTSPRAS
jgi:hypothetical protein